ncbi:hypothetical protein EU538_10485 [Candidatus Thorarchaeota archaeon]|nr:MAG: hypothetical protein EU538_10485 [Candidatus Thorarchaeota archaeon]
MSERRRILKAIKKCLSDTYEHFQNTMDALDEIGRGSMGTAMTPFVGGYGMNDPVDSYRKALIELDSAEKSLKPLAIRVRDGRVNESHFQSDEAVKMLRDLIDFDYEVLIRRLSQREGRESVWYRLKETSQKCEEIYQLVAEK